MTPICKKSLKLYFEDFWPNFDLDNNIFYHLLSSHYEIELTNRNPDLLLHSVFGSNFMNYNCLKILYTGENQRNDFDIDDYSISFDHIDNINHFRFPLYYLWMNDHHQRLDKDEVLKIKTGFCSFVVSNPMSSKRNNFFKKLSKYKKVVSGGKVLNNTGNLVQNKIEFLKNYKFNIAFENSSYPGYTTEKILDAFVSSAIPIYWGNELVHEDFNPKSFINYNDFKNENELIDYIVYLDENDDKYIEMYNQFDLAELKNRKETILRKLEVFLVSAINQYLEYGITKSKYNNSSKFGKFLISQRYYLELKFRYYTIALEHRAKSMIFIK